MGWKCVSVALASELKKTKKKKQLTWANAKCFHGGQQRCRSFQYSLIQRFNSVQREKRIDLFKSLL